MTGSGFRVLSIEDDASDARFIESLLAEHPCDVVTTSGLSTAIALLAEQPFDVALVDLSRDPEGGVEAITRVNESADATVIALDSSNDPERATEATRAGALAYLVKGQLDDGLLMSFVRCAIERQRARRALRVSEARISTLLEAIPGMMFTMHADGSFVDIVLPKDTSALPDELVNKKTGETCPDELEEQYRECLALAIKTRTKQMFRHEEKVKGSLEHYETTFVANGREEALAIVRNTTEATRIEERHRPAQRLEAVGRLAGGIAHDFNNILTVISGNAELALLDLDDEHDDENRQTLQEISEAAERAANLTRQLLAFSRKQVIKPVPLDLNAMVRGTETMLRRLIGEDVELLSDLDPELETVQADPAQIEQILMNLAVNARDAMPHGGKLIFETENVDVYETYIGQRMEIRSGPYVKLAVSDTGEGMTPETRAKAFEPFFTTKDRGKGTGLGLSTVYGIVKQSNGHVWVYSEPGLGTTVKIYFPPVDSAATVPLLRNPDQALHGLGETILLVEDDKNVLAVAHRFLDNGGYNVIPAAGIAEAIEIVTNHPEEIHLMATDVVMPGMSGRDLAAEIQPIRPDMKILYLSGYTDDAILHHGVLEPGVAFLEKPYSSPKLLRAVRDVLDG